MKTAKIFLALLCAVHIPNGLVRADNQNPGNLTLEATNLIEAKSDKLLFGIDVKVDMSTVPDVQLDDNYEEWQAPDYIRKGYPFYLSGFDDSGIPSMFPFVLYILEQIWISEFGKFGDLYSIAHGPKEDQRDFRHYFRQFCYLAIKSQKIISPNVTQHIFIVDFEGIRIEELSRLADPTTVKFVFGYARKYRRYFEKHLAKMYVINVNPMAEVIVNLARPLFGRMLNRIESYGTKKEQWMSRFLQVFPKDQLPEWYGGEDNHKPVYVLG